MVITFSNYKGGSGKTISVINIGACLSKEKYKVLLIDFDPQENLSYALSQSPSGLDVINILQEQKIDINNIFHLKEYDLIRGNNSLSTIDKILPEKNKELILRNVLESVKMNYDFILIDTPPTLSFLTLTSLIASDFIVIPSQADPFSIQGIHKIVNSLNSINQKYHYDKKILGIILTRYNQRTVIRKELTSLIKDVATTLNTKVFTPVRECTSLLESITTRKNIIEYAPTSNGAKDYQLLTAELLETIKTIHGGLK